MDWGKIIFGVFLLIIAYYYNILSESLPAPEHDLDEHWGKSGLENFDESIRKFEISFDEDKIQKLKQKLEDAGPFVEPLEGVAFQYGFNSNKLKEILKYWKDEYLPKWPERQKLLNKFPQFKTKIQGLDIHFIHVKPNVEKDVKIFPLMLLHGWPSSSGDFYKMIPMLTKSSNESIAFEVVVPDLPGFAFSDGASRPGLGPDKMAVILRNLMIRLKHEKFYIHGGDWGGVITNHLATLFPQNVLGLHSNFQRIITPMMLLKTFIASYFPSFFVDSQKYVSWMFPQAPQVVDLLFQESGYLHIQATKPDTVGIVLNGNPAGLAAYILEKFSTATNKIYREQMDGGLDAVFTREELIDNIMIYYITNCMTTAARIYKENFNPQTMMMSRVVTKVPVGVAYFKNEFYPQFPFLLREKFLNIVQVSYYDEGGHFAPLEVPEILYQDIVNFVAKTVK